MFGIVNTANGYTMKPPNEVMFFKNNFPHVNNYLIIKKSNQQKISIFLNFFCFKEKLNDEYIRNIPVSHYRSCQNTQSSSLLIDYYWKCKFKMN
jgi:hypothetical protein